MYRLTHNIERLLEKAPHPVLTTPLKLYVGDDGRHHGIKDDEGPTRTVTVRPAEVELCTCWSKAVKDPNTQVYLVDADNLLHWEEYLERVVEIAHGELDVESLALLGEMCFDFKDRASARPIAVTHAALQDWASSIQRCQERSTRMIEQKLSSPEAKRCIEHAALRYAKPNPVAYLVTGTQNRMGVDNSERTNVIRAAQGAFTLKESPGNLSLLQVSGTVFDLLWDSPEYFVLGSYHLLSEDPDLLATIVDLYSPQSELLSDLANVVAAAKTIHAR